MIFICFDDTFVSLHRPGGQSGLSGHSSCSTDEDPSSWFEQSPSAPSSGNIGRQLLVLCLQPVPHVTEHGSQSVQAVQLPGFPMSVDKRTHKSQSWFYFGNEWWWHHDFSTQWIFFRIEFYRIYRICRVCGRLFLVIFIFKVTKISILRNL